ncbi:MAG: FAD-dependent oxidoreductase, partial [Cyanobacteriota bacterium]
SFGGVAWWSGPPGPLGDLMRQAPRQWRRWQRRHGDLGWRRCRLQLHGPGGSALARIWPRRFSRVDGQKLRWSLPTALQAAGVERLALGPLGPLTLEPRPGTLRRRGLSLVLPDRPPLHTDRVVLAAGAGCRGLWPDLPAVLRSSWAGVLALEQRPAAVPGDRIQLPRHWQRPGLERRAASLTDEEWIVDPGLAPWEGGLLVGQISLVTPEPATAPEPERARMEERLRHGLAGWTPGLATLDAPYRQAAVAFSSDGLPLVGPVPGQPGLWIFTGFSGAFSQVPVLAPVLARCLTASLTAPSATSAAPLKALGVLPR